MRECTFRPHTNPNPSYSKQKHSLSTLQDKMGAAKDDEESSQKYGSNRKGKKPDDNLDVVHETGKKGNKCLELYERGKQNKKERRDVTKEEYEYMKAKEECTFKPTTKKNEQQERFGHRRDTVQSTTTLATVGGPLAEKVHKATQDVIQRMRKGYEDRVEKDKKLLKSDGQSGAMNCAVEKNNRHKQTFGDMMKNNKYVQEAETKRKRQQLNRSPQSRFGPLYPEPTRLSSGEQNNTVEE